MGRRGILCGVLTALMLAPAVGRGQAVVTEGSSDVALDRRLARLLDADPLILTSNTRIRAGDTVAQSVLVLDATLIHEGVIMGDLVIVDAGAFVRHEAVVNGDLVNVAGGLYRSERARVGGAIIDLPEASYRVLRQEERLVIEATATPSRLALDGFLGFHTPSYDRVNGLTTVWGAGYRLPRVWNATPTVSGQVGWRTELGEPTYGGRLEVRSGALSLVAGHDRGWRTREGWAWNDVRNSLNYLWDGDDFRNYYQAERSWVSLRQVFGDTEKKLFADLRLTGQVENATSLGADRPWHLLGDAPRSNPAIDDGRITSLMGRLDLEWHGFQTDFVGGLAYETAREWQGGEFVFDRVAAGGKFAMDALFDHTLEIQVFGQLPVNADSTPRQRWTILGGAGTLNTAPIGFVRGDHVAWIESRYRIPTPAALGLPVLGPPEVQLIHVAGNAWTADLEGDLLQEVGLRLQFFSLYLQYMLQPSDPGQDNFLIGAAWPFTPRYSWELSGR